MDVINTRDVSGNPLTKLIRKRDPFLVFVQFGESDAYFRTERAANRWRKRYGGIVLQTSPNEAVPPCGIWRWSCKLWPMAHAAASATDLTAE